MTRQLHAAPSGTRSRRPPAHLVALPVYPLDGGMSNGSDNRPASGAFADQGRGAAAAEAAGRSHQLLVLHDAVPPAMRHLDTFLGRLADAGHGFRQAHPADCVPIRRGAMVGSLAGLVAA